MSMELGKMNIYFFFFFLILISVVVFFIFKPFLTAIVMAAIFAAVFYKPYLFFVKITNDRKSLSSFFTVILVLFIIIIPLFVLGSFLIEELNSIYHEYLADKSFVENQLEKTVDFMVKIYPGEEINIEKIFNQDGTGKTFQKITQGMFSFLQNVYESASGIILWIFVMFFTLYYFLIDGKILIKKMMYLIPLRDMQEEEMIKKFISISRATLKGTIIMGITQGAIGFLVFVIVGIKSPVLWGVVMAFFSLVPLLGASVVWIPAGIILIFSGNIWQGILVLGVGFGIISTIDNILRPKLVGRDTQMHPLLVFFSTIGGIIMFGFSGFVIGPIFMSLFLTLWGIYDSEFKKQLKVFNK